MAIFSRTLPDELVFIDDKTLFFHKNAIDLDQIQSIRTQGFTLIIKPKQGRSIRQGYIGNCTECAQKINERLEQKA